MHGDRNCLYKPDAMQWMANAPFCTRRLANTARATCLGTAMPRILWEGCATVPRKALCNRKRQNITNGGERRPLQSRVRQLILWQCFRLVNKKPSQTTCKLTQPEPGVENQAMAQQTPGKAQQTYRRADPATTRSSLAFSVNEFSRSCRKPEETHRQPWTQRTNPYSQAIPAHPANARCW
jgi:hypothetical protein